MEDNRCFEPGCMRNVEYACPCASPLVYTCKLHALNHMEVPNKDHAFNSIFAEPCEKTREAILKFLVKRASKHSKLMEKVLASFSQRFIDLRELMKEINSYSGELNNCFRKISEAKGILKSEQDSVLALLNLQPDEAIEKLKTIIPSNPDWYKNSKMFIGFNEKVEKMTECYVENKPQYLEGLESSDLGRKFRYPPPACKSDSSNPEASITQAYQDTVNTHQQKPSLFNLAQKDNRTNLIIFNTEIESQASIVLDTPQPLNQSTCITQLPNGKLFCYGKYKPYSGITLLIDENYRMEELPSGTACGRSSAIYFKNNVYCFGGWYNNDALTLSSRFDLDRNQWNELTPLKYRDYVCTSIIFNENILISGSWSSNLLRYSIDSNSFSTIPYNFAGFRNKTLIKAERLYLIECLGSIYESEIGSDTAWRKIVYRSTINFEIIQAYCQYNKGEIYIGFINYNKFFCFKFKSNEKRFIKLV